MLDWTEKYRPKNLNDIIGNERAVSELHRWATAWRDSKIPKKRAVILSGKPGIGKTSSALALAHDFGWTIIELNASDARNAVNIKRVATSGAINETFDNKGQFVSTRRGGRKLIILDEADNLYEKSEGKDGGNDFSDRGGKRAIIETIKIAQQPIILIVNDYYSLVKEGGDDLKNLCTIIRFYPVSPSAIAEFLKRICREEGITAEGRLLQTIAERCKGDVRSAVNDLQSICFDKKQVDLESLDVVGYRDREKIIFDALREIFKTRNLQSIRENTAHMDETPDMFLLWLHENLPAEYRDIDDLVRGYEALSKADVFLGRVERKKNYGLWSYACDIMNGGVAMAKTHEYGNETYQFPMWLKELKSYKSTRSLRDDIIKKMGKLFHNSGSKSKESMLPYFRTMFRNNTEFAVAMKNRLDLTEAEIAYLLGEQYAHKMKEIVQSSEKMLEKSLEKETPVSEEKDKKETIQPSLFDFS